MTSQLLSDFDINEVSNTIDFAISVSVGLINISIESGFIAKLCNLFKSCFSTGNNEEKEILKRVKRPNNNNHDDVAVNDIIIDENSNNNNQNEDNASSSDMNEATSADN